LSTTRGEIARAVLEGIAFELAQGLEVVEELCGPVAEVHASGGLTRSALFGQIQSDVMQRPVSSFGGGEATSQGAWIAGAVASGLVADYRAAFALLSARQPPVVYRPTPRCARCTGCSGGRARAVYDALAARSSGLSFDDEIDVTKDLGQRAMRSVSNYRHKKILEMVYQRKSVSADELAAEFGVSKITIRRDLDTLALDKLLERTRGGAICISDLGFEEIFETKDHTAKKEKALIGKYVASLIAENDTVFLNAGSTTLEVVRHLQGKKRGWSPTTPPACWSSWIRTSS